MWTGVSALKNIDQTLQTIRNEVVRLDSQLTQLTNKLTGSQRQRLQLLQEIARIRLQAIDQEGLQTMLSSTDRQVAMWLDKREQALITLNEEIERLNRDVISSEQVREQRLDAVNLESQKLVDLEQQVQQQLKNDDVYLALFEEAKQTESIAKEAEQKAQQSEQQMDEKAQPYEEDELFMYLYKRGFGTTNYAGGLITRWLDGWVAGLIKYEPARVNYWNLQEIPTRLQQHAQSVANIADEKYMALQQHELDTLAQAGKAVLEQTLDVLRKSLDQQDDDIEALEAQLSDSLSQRASYISGQDEYMLKSIEYITEALEHQDLQSIHRYVRETISPTDDSLVLELQGLNQRMDDVSEDLSDIRTLHDNKLSKLKELESVRRNFKNNRFDDVRSGFGNESLLAGVLGQFLQGAVGGGDLWRVFQRNQRYRDIGSLPDFGSGGLGDLLGGRRTSRRGSSWHLPKPRRGGGGFRVPNRGSSRPASRSRGGFRTGGGF